MAIVTFLTISMEISLKAIALPSVRSVWKNWMPSDVISSPLEKDEQTQSRLTFKMVIALEPQVKGTVCHMKAKSEFQHNIFLPIYLDIWYTLHFLP